MTFCRNFILWVHIASKCGEQNTSVNARVARKESGIASVVELCEPRDVRDSRRTDKKCILSFGNIFTYYIFIRFRQTQI